MKRIFSLILILALLAGACAVPVSASAVTADTALKDAAAYLVKTVPKPEYANVGGGWTVLALARSGCSVPDSYFAGYYAAVVTQVQSCKGVLSENKYTEYERVALALTAIGRDPTNVGGYNLLLPLGDYDKTVAIGVNSACYALLALDAGSYPVPVNAAAATQATRELYVAYILNRQLRDGGWAMSGDSADPDMTAIALQALAPYRSNAAVESAVLVALDCLSKIQNSDGGFTSWGTVTSESVSQVLLALTSLGVSVTDSRFVKNGRSALDALLSFCITGGGFRHSTASDLMATEQAVMALTAVERAAAGRNSLYRMSDVTAASGGGSQTGSTVKPLTVVKPDTTFTDIQGHANQKAIEALAGYGVISGMGGGLFAPDATMTRAQFAKIVVSALSLAPEYRATFTDAPQSAWYSAYVDTAAAYGIVKGIGAGKYNPNGTITRQEAATMVARAAALCGADTTLSADAARNILCVFSDYTAVSSYAAASMAYCYKSGILDDSGLTIQPGRAVLRCEIAQMLYNLLIQADLLQ